MWHGMSNTTLLLIAIAIMMMVAIPVAAILRDVLPRLVERAAHIERAESRIYVLHSEAQELAARIGDLINHRNRRSGDVRRLEGEIRKMEKAIADLAAQPPVFVHEVGTPQAGLTRFVANVSLERASAQARGSGDRAAANPIWRFPNVAEVWARTQEEARAQVDVAFPFKLGYATSFVSKPSDTERLAEAALKAVHQDDKPKPAS